MADSDHARGAATDAPARPPRAPRDERSVGDLIRELGSESTRLVREEVELAKAEMREKLDVYEKNVVKMLLGGALLLGAFAVLLVAVNRGLTALLGQFMAVDIAVWLAPLILAVVFGLIGWGMVKGAQRAMGREGVAPKRTLDTLREEKDWAKREVKEIRNG